MPEYCFYFSPLAFRKFFATSLTDFLSTSTSAFKADMVAASGHTAVKVAAAALQAAGSTDGAAVRDAISKTSLTASTGEISFNGLGEVKKDVQVQVVKDGNWHHHSVISDPELLAPPE